MRTQLNDLMVRNLPVPASGQVQYPDGKIPGFGVRVTAAGVKTFYLTYRVHGRSRRLTLGRYPYTSLAEARIEAHNTISAIAKGEDPQRVTPTTPTFEVAVASFVEMHCQRRNRMSTAAETERILLTVFVPEWGGRFVSSIGRQDVTTVIDGVMNRGATSAAIHAFAAIRKFFNWCVERGTIETSPCSALKPPAKPVSRDRVLSDDELKVVLAAAVQQGWPYGPIVQLLALTAQRRGEVVGMMWDELDLKAKAWNMPGARTKNGRPHVVQLTDQAIAVIQSLRRVDGCPFVFPARGFVDRPYSGYSKGKRELDALANLHDWTLHDLRRTAATGMARGGVAPHVVERILNHVSGTFAGVAGVYNRFGYLDEMRAALILWERHILKITGEGK